MSATKHGLLIAGAGMTGLAAAVASGATVLEAAAVAGGICRSHPVQGTFGSWRFDFGGGHWVFGGDPMLDAFLSRFGRWKRYRRRASVWLPELSVLVPYPIQNNLHALPERLAAQIWLEMNRGATRPAALDQWLLAVFGPTLNELFFAPFHQLYTAGLADSIAADDLFKTPLDLAAVERGMRGPVEDVGYNTTFLYPEGGLSRFVERLQSRCRVELACPVQEIDLEQRRLRDASGAWREYGRMICTLPLHEALRLSHHPLAEQSDPHTSVLVSNIGATRGPRCPDDHWIYFPASRSGFHRVGFYSNVDPAFVPHLDETLASLYVERAFPAGSQPGADAVRAHESAVISELRDLGYIGEVDAVSSHWLETAYTWRKPGSQWRDQAIASLASQGVFQAGRYARWRFQGIAESLREGLLAGSLLRTAP